MSIADVRRLVEYSKEDGGDEPARQTLLRKHKDRLLAQIHDLHECLDLIESQITDPAPVEKGSVNPPSPGTGDMESTMIQAGPSTQATAPAKPAGPCASEANG